MANITVRSGCLAVALDLEGNIAMVGTEEEVTFLSPLPNYHYNLSDIIPLTFYYNVSLHKVI